MADHSDPDQIQREIERTRVDLAETIDAIAEKVSPKRAFSRTATRVRTAVKGDSRTRVEVGVPETGEHITMVAENRPEIGPSTAADRHELHARTTGLPGEGTLYAVRRTLRVDRVLIAVGALAGVAAVVVIVRRVRQ